MSLAVSVLILLAAFAVCAWSGRTLAGNYQDRREVAAVVAVGACLLGAGLLGGRPHGAAAGWPAVALGLAMSAGLVTGYYRAGPRPRSRS